MTYNITGIMNANNPLQFIQAANDLSNGVAGHGLLVLFFCIVLFIGIAHTNHLGKSLLASGMASALIGLLMVLMKLSSWYLPVFFAVVMAVGIAMLQERDYG